MYKFWISSKDIARNDCSKMLITNGHIVCCRTLRHCVRVRRKDVGDKMRWGRTDTSHTCKLRKIFDNDMQRTWIYRLECQLYVTQVVPGSPQQVRRSFFFILYILWVLYDNPTSIFILFAVRIVPTLFYFLRRNVKTRQRLIWVCVQKGIRRDLQEIRADIVERTGHLFDYSRALDIDSE